jgi:hypothetical protein
MTRSSGRATVEAKLGAGKTLQLAIEAPEALLGKLSPTAIPFVPMAMLIAASEARALIVEAQVEMRWWLNLVGGYGPLVASLFDLPKMPVSRVGGQAAWPTKVRSWRESFGRWRRMPAAEFALLFSAGVDSFYSLEKMLEAGVRPRWLVNVNAGAHDEDRRCWEQRISNVRNIAEELNAGLVVIDTNFHTLLPLPHIRSHVIRNIGAAYSLYPAVDNFVYSSAHAFEDISFAAAKTHGIDYLDHTVCSLITPTPISISILGWDATRIEKTARLGGSEMARRLLDVCTDQSYQADLVSGEPINCGRCGKCVRTMLTLDHFGDLQAFASQFPVERFRRDRQTLIHQLGMRSHPVDRAVFDLITATPAGSSP